MNIDKFNKNAVALKPSGIRKFFDLVSQRDDVISLGVGEPDFDTPWVGREAAVKSIYDGFTHYSPNRGFLPLRQLISSYYSERFNISYDPKSEIIVTVGGSEAIDITIRAICEPNDEVVVPSPSYVAYMPCVQLTGAKAVPVECGADDGFLLTPEKLESAITDKTKVLILPYPNNPTGAVMDKVSLEKIAEVIIRHDLIVISDEIYAELTYEGKHYSIASVKGMKERTIIVSGFSKSFAMTGWRIGYLLAPSEAVSVITKIHQYVIMCAPTCAQYAATACLKQGFSDGFATVSEMRAEYDIRRRFLVSEFNDMGLNCVTPQGAFYVFPCVSALNMDGEKFATYLLEKQNVAAVPGNAFGESGKYHVRISYAYSMKNLEEAVKRIRLFVSECR